MDHTGCHELSRVLTAKILVSEKCQPYDGVDKDRRVSGASDLRGPRVVPHGGVHNGGGAERVGDKHDSVHADSRREHVPRVGDSHIRHVSEVGLAVFSSRYFAVTRRFN
jgi:hypothetical protein